MTQLGWSRIARIDPAYTLEGMLADLKIKVRADRLAIAGLTQRSPGSGALVHDPAQLTDRDVDTLILAHQKRQRRKARNRAITERTQLA